MHFSTLLTSALAAAPLAVSAVGTLGFALGNTMADGSTCKQQSDFEADFDAIAAASSARLVRTYSSTNQWGAPCNTPSEVLSAAQNKGFQVLLGMWPDGGSYEKEKAPITDANVQKYGDTLYGITVGSEGMYRGTYQASDLVGWISDMKSSFPGVTIGTADSWNSWQNGSMDSIITSGISLALANGFAYWQYQDISNATATYFDDMAQALGHIQDVSGSLDGIHFMNGETGWPTDGGDNMGAAIASTANANTYWKSAVCGMLDWGVDLFFFEAFDEPNKQAATSTDGTKGNEGHWGAFTSDRSPKWDLSC